jgi:hypothetical protein
MSFISWLRNSKRFDVGQRRRINGASRPRSTFRPRLEALEDRCVPSTLKVSNPFDNLFLDPPIRGSLRYEIAQAKSGDTIAFDTRLDGATITLSGGELYINKNLTIQGPGAGLLTVQGLGRDNYSSRIFEVAYRTDTVNLSGLTISNGDGTLGPSSYYNSAPYYDHYYDGAGGGILNLGMLTISGCILSGNYAYGAAYSAGGGGAIANFGTLTVTGCTLSNNPGAAFGGAIYNDYRGTATVSGCTITNNTGATSGGAIANFGSLTVSGCTLSGNSAVFEGGGILNYGTLTVSGCTLSGNSALYQGGGIWNAGKLTVSNSFFSGNTPDNIFGVFIDGGGNIFK